MNGVKSHSSSNVVIGTKLELDLAAMVQLTDLREVSNP